MSNFAAGASCFLSSVHKNNLFGPNPTTERGYFTNVNLHPKENKIIYPAGKCIVIRSLEDPADTFIYRGHAQPTTVAKFSTNGCWIASGDVSGKIRVWSYDNEQHLLKIEITAFSGPIKDLDWGNDNKNIVACGEGGQFFIKAFMWDTGNTVGELSCINKRVLSCTYKQSRPFRIMCGSEDCSTNFYAGPPFKMDHSNIVHTNFVNCVRYSPDSKYIVSIGSDRKIQIYDGDLGKPTISKDDAHASSIQSVCWKPDSTKFCTASSDKTLKVWNLNLVLEKVLEIGESVGDFQVSVLWNANYIISLSLNSNINIFIETSTTPIRIIESNQGAVTTLFSDENGYIFTGSSDGRVAKLNGNTGEVNTFKPQDNKTILNNAHTNQVIGVGKIDDNILVSAGFDDSLRFASIDTISYVDSISLPAQPKCLAFSKSSTNPSLFAVVTTNNEVSLYKGKNKIASLSKLEYTPTVCALRDDELCVGGEDFKTHVYKISSDFSFSEVATLVTRSAVTALKYSPNEQFLAIGDNGRQVEIYERHNWQVRVTGRWCFHTSRVTCLSWNQNSNNLASGGLDENIFIWDLSNLTKKTQFQFTHSGGVNCIAWMGPKQLISVGNDRSTVTWNVPIE